MSKEEKNMKRVISMVLAMVLVLSLAACGSAKGSSAPESIQENTSASTEKDVENSTSEDADSANDENNQAAVGQTGSAMLDAANTCRQSDYNNNMAFDGEHIYFYSSHDLYQCGYDGSNVRKMDTALENIVAAEGKLWGFYAEYQKPGAVYSLDPETGVMDPVSEMPYAGVIADLLLVSGNWLCYARDSGNELVVHDLTTGEEKTIFTYEFGGLLRSIDSICIYGDTLYALIQDTSKDRNCVLCSYELGSGDDKMTQLSKTLYLGPTTSTIWMDEGIFLIDWNDGCQYYYARFSDIDEDGYWNYRDNEDNKIGTDMYASDAITGVGSWIASPYNSNFVVGNDLVDIGSNVVEYHTDFDFTARDLLVNGDSRCDGSKGCHGIYNGAVYLFLDKTSSAEAEIVKIAEGGTVEHIPVAIPES
jgi:predicted small lipoprotein YifL